MKLNIPDQQITLSCPSCDCTLFSIDENEIATCGTCGLKLHKDEWHCCKVSDEAAFCLIQRPYISKTLLTRRISPRGSP